MGCALQRADGRSAGSYGAQIPRRLGWAGIDSHWLAGLFIIGVRMGLHTGLGFTSRHSLPYTVRQEFPLKAGSSLHTGHWAWGLP